MMIMKVMVMMMTTMTMMTMADMHAGVQTWSRSGSQDLFLSFGLGCQMYEWSQHGSNTRALLPLQQLMQLLLHFGQQAAS